MAFKKGFKPRMKAWLRRRIKSGKGHMNLNHYKAWRRKRR